MNRLEFLDSITGIKYPEMLADFFDHFVALKQIVEDSGSINVINNTETKIIFSISFKNRSTLSSAVNAISALNGSIVIYERYIPISMEVSNETSLVINLG